MENELAPDMRGEVLGHGVIATCTGLSDEVSNPQRRLTVTNAPKILMLNAVYDPSTPYTWAVNAQRLHYRACGQLPGVHDSAVGAPL